MVSFVLFCLGCGGWRRAERDRDQGEDSRTGGGEVEGGLGEAGGVVWGTGEEDGVGRGRKREREVERRICDG